MIHENVTQPRRLPTEVVPRLSSLAPYTFFIREGVGFG